MHSSVSERRVKPRYRLQFPLMISNGSTGDVKGITRDVSEYGAYFYTEHHLTVGQPVQFKILMPVNGTTSRALCKATVLRIDSPDGAGAQPNGVAVHMTSVQLV